MINQEDMDCHAIMQALPGLFVLLDARLAIVEISNAYARSTMIQRDAVLGKGMFEVFPDNPADPVADGVRNLHASLRRVLHSGMTDTMAVQKYDIRKPQSGGNDFEERYWTVINSPVLDAKGHVRYIIHKAEDVTEFIHLKQKELEGIRLNQGLTEQAQKIEAEIIEHTREVAAASSLLKTANQELEMARAAAETANLAKSAFLATMSHEIRTPMNGVLGMVNLLRRSHLDEKQQHYLNRIQTSGQHLLALINDILDLSKIEAGKVELASDDFRLSELIQDTLSLIEERAKAKSLELKIFSNPTDLNLRGDKIRLQQMIINLLGNAVKFTEHGSITLNCRVKQKTIDSYLMCFEVTDTGIGMTKEQQQRLFVPFEQADNSISRKYQGTGLGLTITKRIAELMGGETGAKSVIGQGSTFWFTCRLGKGQETKPAQTYITESAEVILARDFKDKKILVAEDDPTNREIIGIILQECGLQVDVAFDGQEAVTRVQQADYDMVLMDMQMPVMDGLQATQIIRTMPGKKDLVIIAITANAFDDDRVKCLAAGMNDYIAKPYYPVHLFEKLVQWLGRQGRQTDIKS